MTYHTPTAYRMSILPRADKLRDHLREQTSVNRNIPPSTFPSFPSALSITCFTSWSDGGIPSLRSVRSFLKSSNSSFPLQTIRLASNSIPQWLPVVCVILLERLVYLIFVLQVCSP
mmetsp:Transcript_41672/g.131371  ORF Transcript_41672/g.131371 Transcript_41672/m.131371 type:complete len:116 (-) Transcript_41672:1203-1550(-)